MNKEKLNFIKLWGLTQLLFHIMLIKLDLWIDPILATPKTPIFGIILEKNKFSDIFFKNIDKRNSQEYNSFWRWGKWYL